MVQQIEDWLNNVSRGSVPPIRHVAACQQSFSLVLASAPDVPEAITHRTESSFTWGNWVVAAREPRRLHRTGADRSGHISCLLAGDRRGLVWNDSDYVTRPELRSLHGLGRIWFDLGATEQYYPLLHSLFWIQSQLWGKRPLGHHLVNVLLHLTAVGLLYLILRKLKIPGALLAAGIFALHPVMVESVAWITEQKNTLSTVFYLGALLVYLDFDQTRRSSDYAISLVLFILAMASKTVTATLPAALLVIFWWQRGRLSWRRDVRPLAPWFALGISAGLFTAWVEFTYIGAEGAEFSLSGVQRLLIASRVPWFYAAKLLWPANLIFMYPRWDIDATAWWQWMFPLATVALLSALWHLRRRWRGPLAACLLFVGTLFPVLGFLNVYWFVFAFAADHLQYLASISLIVPAAAGVALAIGRLQARWAGLAMDFASRGS